MKLWIAKPAEAATVPDAEEPKWAPFETTHISLNYTQTLAALNTRHSASGKRDAARSALPSKEGDSSKQEVQDQVQQLTDSNRELRERLDDQSKKTKELSEEVDRLRQGLDQTQPVKPPVRKHPLP
jgi:hypothetical protein